MNSHFKCNLELIIQPYRNCCSSPVCSTAITFCIWVFFELRHSFIYTKIPNLLKKLFVIIGFAQEMNLSSPLDLQEDSRLANSFENQTVILWNFEQYKTLGIIPLATVTEKSLSCVQISRRLQHTSSVQNCCNTSLSGRADHGQGEAARAGLWSSHHFHCPFSIAAMAGSCFLGGLHIRRKQKGILKRKSNSDPSFSLLK